MNPSHHYDLPSDGVEVYERFIVAGVMKPFAHGVIEAAHLSSGQALIDVACGTGIVARMTKPIVGGSGRVVGVDINAAMLTMAAQLAQIERIAVEWREASVTGLPFETSSFDVALCHHGLQYFPHRVDALTEIRRVLRPGGRLVASVWRPVRYNPGHHAFANALEKYVSALAAAERRTPFSFSEPTDVREAFMSAGFENTNITLDARVARFPSPKAMIEIMVQGSPLAKVLDPMSRDAMSRVVEAVSRDLEPYLDDVGLALPMQSWVISATA